MSSSGNDASMSSLTKENEVKIASLDSDRTSAQEHNANLGNISHEDNINNNAASIDNIQHDYHNQIVENHRSTNCSKENIDYLMHELSKNGCLPHASIVVFNNHNIQVSNRCLLHSFDNLKPTPNSTFPRSFPDKKYGRAVIRYVYIRRCGKHER